jgi:hypothetical protein
MIGNLRRDHNVYESPTVYSRLPGFISPALDKIRIAGNRGDSGARHSTEEGRITLSVTWRLNEANERIETARLIETAARRALALSQTAFANGLVTRLSVTEAANRLDEASLGLQNAVCEYRLAWYDWEIASGNAEALTTE